MRSFCIFADALEFIEAHLCEEITQQDIADACCCSLSNLQKVWKYCTHTGVKEYITKRRLAICAKELLHSNRTITEIAFMYQFNSSEVFTRAFRRMWGVSPSEFRAHWKNADLFPPISAEQMNGGYYMGRRADLSELYDMLKAKSGTYVLCFDVAHLMPINDTYGHKAGDAVILEAYRRIDSAAGDDMTVFRIGGDEFAMVTGLSDRESTEKTAAKVLSLNNEPIDFEGTSIPVSIRAGAIRYETSNVRYNELFSRLYDSVINSIDNGSVAFAE